MKKTWFGLQANNNIMLEQHLDTIQIPANLRINDQIKKYRKRCASIGCRRPYHHFAFGQSPFSPPKKIIQALKDNAHKHDYVPTAGIPELRVAISNYYNKIFSIKCKPEQIVVSPGSKEMISMILGVLQGAVIIPTPSWVSYLPQAGILKKEVLPIKLTPENNYKLTPAVLEDTIRHHSGSQYILILNNPNNPTGAVYSRTELKELAIICRKHHVIVIADEIYARTSFYFQEFVSMAAIYPEGTIVTGGLSKDRSAGGYRLGLGIFPNDKKLLNDILILAGSTYSCVASPIQYAALEAFSLNQEIENYIQHCAQIHQAVGHLVSRRLNNIPGIKATVPQGAFYLFVDFNYYFRLFKKIGFDTCADFCEHLIKVEHTALLPGNSLLLPEDDFSVRLSYVDYDGDALLKAWQQNRPVSENEKEQFFEEHCPLLDQGIKNIERYLAQLKKGKRPVHV